MMVAARDELSIRYLKHSYSFVNSQITELHVAEKHGACSEVRDIGVTTLSDLFKAEEDVATEDAE